MLCRTKKIRNVLIRIFFYVHLIGCHPSHAQTIIKLSDSITNNNQIVNFCNWTDYIKRETLDQCQKSLNLRVVYDTYDSNETLEGKLLLGNSGFDLVTPSYEFYNEQLEVGVYERLDKKKLTFLQNYDPQFSLLADEQQFGVPYMWGTTGIGYNRKKIEAILGAQAPTESWQLVFDPKYIQKLHPFGVAFLDSPTEILPLVMAYLGFSEKTITLKEYEAALDVVRKIRPYITYFHSSKYIADLAAGNICIAVGWSGDVLMAKTRACEANNGIDISYVVPKEGSAMWIDMLAIPKGAKHIEQAYQLINYLMKDDVIAQTTSHNHYANVLKTSRPFISKDVIENTMIYPEYNTRQRLTVLKPIPRNFKASVARSWSRVKIYK